jgi:hypothetical protein
MRLKSPRKNQAQKEAPSYLARGIENLDGRLKFLEGELPIRCGLLDPVDQWRSEG